MIHNIIYNGKIFAVVDIPVRELKNYKRILFQNLPKATMERKVKPAK